MSQRTEHGHDERSGDDERSFVVDVGATRPEAGGRVVVGVDGSSSSVRALRWAAAYAHSAGVSLEVVIAWDWQRSIGWSTPILAGLDPEGDARRVADKCLERLHAEWPDLVTESRVQQGHPSPVLVTASKDAGLLVVGCRGHGEFTGMLLGSVSEFCATHAECPVLVYRERDGHAAARESVREDVNRAS